MTGQSNNNPFDLKSDAKKDSENQPTSRVENKSLFGFNTNLTNLAKPLDTQAQSTTPMFGSKSTTNGFAFQSLNPSSSNLSEKHTSNSTNEASKNTQFSFGSMSAKSPFGEKSSFLSASGDQSNASKSNDISKNNLFGSLSNVSTSTTNTFGSQAKPTLAFGAQSTTTIPDLSSKQEASTPSKEVSFGDQWGSKSSGSNSFSNQPSNIFGKNVFENQTANNSNVKNMFGTQNTSSTSSPGLLGNQSNSVNSFPFGNNSASNTGLFNTQGKSEPNEAEKQPSNTLNVTKNHSTTTTPSANLFGNQATGSASPSSNLFAKQPVTSTTPSANLFSNQATGSASPSSNLFAKQPAASTAPSSNLFGDQSTTTTAPSTNVFAKQSATSTAPSLNLFGGQSAASTPALNLFGAQNSPSQSKANGQSMPTTSVQGSQINSTNAADNKTSSFQFPSTTASTTLLGSQATNNTNTTDKQASNLFDSQTNSQPKTTNNIFGSQATAPSTQAPTSSSLNARTSAGSVTTQALTSNLFGEKRSSVSENQFSAQTPISTQPTISTTNVLGAKVSEPTSTSGVPVSSSTVNALGSSTNVQANASNDKKNEHVVKEYDLNPNQTVGEFMTEQLKRLQQLQSHYNTKSAELFEIDNKVKLDGGKINRIYKTLEQLENSQNTIINYLDYMEKEQKEIETILLEGERSFQNAYALRDSYKKPESSTLTSAAVTKDLEREKLYSMVDIINHRAIEATKDLSELASASNEMMSKIFEGIDPSLRQNVDGFKYESKLTRNIVREMKKEASIMGFKNEQ